MIIEVNSLSHMKFHIIDCTQYMYLCNIFLHMQFVCIHTCIEVLKLRQKVNKFVYASYISKNTL